MGPVGRPSNISSLPNKAGATQSHKKSRHGGIVIPFDLSPHCWVTGSSAGHHPSLELSDFFLWMTNLFSFFVTHRCLNLWFELEELWSLTKLLVTMGHVHVMSFGYKTTTTQESPIEEER